MSELLTIGLLIIFLVHLAAFTWLTFRHKRSDYLLASLAFLALVLSTAVRTWWPDLDLRGQDLHVWLRALGWIATAAAAFLFIKYKIKPKKALE